MIYKATGAFYKRLALEMALRHPQVVEMIGKPSYLFDVDTFCGSYNHSPINKEMADELYRNFGINTECIDIAEDGREVIIYDINRAKINRPPKIGEFLGREIELCSENDILDYKPPTKLTPADKGKNGLLIKTIFDNKLFEWYDAIYKISGRSIYSLDETKKTTGKAKKDCKILHEYIITKRWFELLP